MQSLLTSSRAVLADLAARDLDLLVIGGGITGAGVLRDAAMRGLRAALVERADFGAGTSSRSSRLIHGGLRYLEHYQFGLVFEALRERKVLLRIAPHLVHRLAFIVPVHRGDRVPRWKLAAGLTLYGLLAAGGNVPRPRMLGKAELLAMEPNIRVRGLRGGGLYHDARCDDARLVLATLRAALASGADAVNYAEASDLLIEGGRVTGVRVSDLIHGGSADLRARVIINATGPWTDRVRRLEDPNAPALLHPTKGAHVVVRRSRLGHTHAITFTSPLDGRVMFILPWGELTCIGTTETELADVDQGSSVDRQDELYLLRSANALFPHAHLGPEDIVSSWAGVRPLLAGPPDRPATALSREHRILTGAGGMITVAGGKLTTYRTMAAETVDAAVLALHGTGARRRWPRPATAGVPLPGGESATWDPFRKSGLELGLPAATVEHLIRLHGTETAAVLNLVREDRSLAAPIHPAHPAIGAEVIHAARRELAQRVEDVLARRLHLTTETSDRGLAAARRTAELLGRELGWAEARIAVETRRFDPGDPSPASLAVRR